MWDISRKIRANLRFKIEKGEYIGHAPFGYRKSATEKNKLCVDEETAPIVKEIFRLYREGYGYSFIANHLTAREYPTPSRGSGKFSDRWSPVAVARILGNRVYTGDTVQGVSEKVSFKSKKTRRLPEARWVTTRDTHEAIVSRKEFEEVWKIREEKGSKKGLHKGRLHVFKGMLYCGRCGSSLYARKRSGRPMAYVCSSYAKNGREGCTSHYIAEAALRAVIVQEILEMLKTDAVAIPLKKRLQERPGGDEDKDKELAKLEQQLRMKLKQQDTLYMDKLEGKVSEQLFSRINPGLENKIQQLKNEMEKIKSREADEAGEEDEIQSACALLEDGYLTYEMMRLLIGKITVYDPGDQLPDGSAVFSNEQKKRLEKHGAVVIDFRSAPMLQELSEQASLFR